MTEAEPGPGEPPRKVVKRESGEGFKPIRQIGVANSIGFPLLMIGLFMLFIANSAGGTALWVAAITLMVVGFFASASGRVL